MISETKCQKINSKNQSENKFTNEQSGKLSHKRIKTPNSQRRMQDLIDNPNTTSDVQQSTSEEPRTESYMKLSLLTNNGIKYSGRKC